MGRIVRREFPVLAESVLVVAGLCKFSMLVVAADGHVVGVYIGVAAVAILEASGRLAAAKSADPEPGPHKGH